MNWKLLGYIGAIFLTLVLTIGVGVKMIQKTEGYRAQEQNFYSMDYHPLIGGCSRYEATRKPDSTDVKKEVKPAIKQEVKKEVKSGK